MSSNRDNSDYLNDILTSIDEIVQFTSGMSYEDFLKDVKTRHAVIRSLEILGEAAKNVAADIKESNPGIPWRKMAGLRDFLAHEYFGVDYRIVWQVREKELPVLRPMIEQLVKK